MPSCTSPPVSASTLPISRVIARETSALRSTSSCPTRCNTCPRIGAGVFDHCANPRFAAAIARGRSAAPERENSPIGSCQSAGLRFSKYSPVDGATQSPAMKFLNRGAVMISLCGTKEGHGGLSVNPGQELPTGERDTPNDQNDRQRVGDAEPPFPGRQRAPDARDGHDDNPAH